MSVPSSFGVSATSGVLGSWLASSTSSVSVANLLGGSSSTSSGGALSALLTRSASSAPSTTEALAGLLKPSQQRVIQAIGDSGGQLSIPWNANGTEPTTVAALRTAGWIKLDTRVLTNGKSTGGTYDLTKLGTEIYNRTAGGRVGANNTPLTSADTNGPASATAALQSSVSSLTSILGAVGISV